jgi:radical SAM enzyme (TIGR01210 family)
MKNLPKNKYVREPIPLDHSDSQNSRGVPAYLELTAINISNQPAKRLMAVLKTRGCEYARKDKGCTMCGFWLHGDSSVNDIDLINQLENIISFIEGYPHPIDQLDLLTLGSFFDEKEITSEFRTHSLKRIGTIRKLTKVCVETRASHVVDEKLEEIRKLLGNKMVEIGIGVESSNDYIRNEILNKGLSWKQLERAVSLIGKFNLEFQPFLLIKPHKLSETEAINDAVQSARDVTKLAEKYNVKTRIAFEPVFVPYGTELEKLYLSGDYKIVNLWSVIEVIKLTHGLSTIFVGMSDEGLAGDRIPYSCDKCSMKLREAIQSYNATQNLEVFNNLDCSCKQEWRVKVNNSSKYS